MTTIAALKEFSFFKDFNGKQLKKLAALAKEESHPAGTQLYSVGDEARSLYFIKAGKVALLMDNYMGPGKPPMQVTVDMITKGESMGWSAVVEPFLYTLGARCIEDTKMIALNAEQLREVMDEECELGFKILQSTAKVIATRLTHTRIILVGERGLSTLTEY
ncbi:MAG: cyclic nucleotide-binding domain-containing protein [Deltaproteobacteria bacterium]|nr:cyclic nucleotide-binding domain-containing protein [Deltaproteobacteria bacterium]